jgi:hypothetical protein
MPEITITIEEPGEWRRPMRFAWKGGLDEVKQLAALGTQWAEVVRADPSRQIEVISDPLVHRSTLAALAAVALEQPAAGRPGVIADYLELYDIESWPGHTRAKGSRRSFMPGPRADIAGSA